MSTVACKSYLPILRLHTDFSIHSFPCDLGEQSPRNILFHVPYDGPLEPFLSNHTASARGTKLKATCSAPFAARRGQPLSLLYLFLWFFRFRSANFPRACLSFSSTSLYCLGGVSLFEARPQHQSGAPTARRRGGQTNPLAHNPAERKRETQPGSARAKACIH